MSGNKSLTKTKGHISIKIQKSRNNNPNLDLIMVNANAKFNQIPSTVHKILSVNKILTITKTHNYVANLRNLLRNNHNPDLDKVIAYAKFDQIPSILSEDIEQKWNSDNNQGP